MSCLCVVVVDWIQFKLIKIRIRDSSTNPNLMVVCGVGGGGEEEGEKKDLEKMNFYKKNDRKGVSKRRRMRE